MNATIYTPKGKIAQPRDVYQLRDTYNATGYRDNTSSRSNGTITLTCDRCKKKKVRVKVSGMVRGINAVPVRDLSIYPPMESYSWLFVTDEGDVCPGCQTEEERGKVERFYQ